MQHFSILCFHFNRVIYDFGYTILHTSLFLPHGMIHSLNTVVKDSDSFTALVLDQTLTGISLDVKEHIIQPQPLPILGLILQSKQNFFHPSELQNTPLLDLLLDRQHCYQLNPHYRD